MAKTALDTSRKLFDSQHARAMPEGYYSGDQPNKNLRDFVELWRTDTAKPKKIEPFNEPLEASKATAIYDLHSYHQGKKAHGGIMRYIRHYTTEGEIVFDPFCGSGSTCLAALLIDRSAVGIDRSPAATFIASNYCSPCQVSDLAAAFERVVGATEQEVGWVYKTQSGDGYDSDLIFQLWSQTFKCSRCLNTTPVFEAPERKVANRSGKSSSHFVCPSCLKRGLTEVIDAEPVRGGLVPVATSYECAATTPKRRFRTRHDSDKREADAFRKFDLTLIDRVQSTKISYPYPTSRMLNCDDRAWGYLWRPYLDGIERACDFFSHRNNLVLSTFLHHARRLGGNHKDRLLFLLSSVLWHASKMSQYKEGGGGIMPGLYYVPPIHKEQNVLRLLRRKFGDFIKAYESYSPKSTNLCLSTQTATDLSAIPSNSIDYIFTDPPYADKVQYGDPERYTHGGLSLAECMIPMIVLGPKMKFEPAFDLSGIRFEGVLSEGQPLDILLTAKARAAPVKEEVLFQLQVDAGLDDTQSRKEVFSGTEHEYRVRWTPKLDNPTAEEHRAGKVVKQATAIASYRWKNRAVRSTIHGTVEIQLDITRIRRRLDSKLDSIMGMVPAGLR